MLAGRLGARSQCGPPRCVALYRTSTLIPVLVLSETVLVLEPRLSPWSRRPGLVADAGNHLLAAATKQRFARSNGSSTSTSTASLSTSTREISLTPSTAFASDRRLVRYNEPLRREATAERLADDASQSGGQLSLRDTRLFCRFPPGHECPGYRRAVAPRPKDRAGSAVIRHIAPCFAEFQPRSGGRL